MSDPKLEAVISENGWVQGLKRIEAKHLEQKIISIIRHNKLALLLSALDLEFDDTIRWDSICVHTQILRPVRSNFENNFNVENLLL